MFQSHRNVKKFLQTSRATYLTTCNLTFAPSPPAAFAGLPINTKWRNSQVKINTHTLQDKLKLWNCRSTHISSCHSVPTQKELSVSDERDEIIFHPKSSNFLSFFLCVNPIETNSISSLLNSFEFNRGHLWIKSNTLAHEQPFSPRHFLVTNFLLQKHLSSSCSSCRAWPKYLSICRRKHWQNAKSYS